MPRNRGRRAIGLAIAVGIAATAIGCVRPIAAAKENHAGVKTASAATKVEVVKPSRHTVRRSTEQPGQIEACEVTPIYAKLSGYARNVSVDIGDRVSKGQLLAELWTPEDEADLQSKRALVVQAESKHTQARASVEVAKAGIATAEAKVIEAQAGIAKAEADIALRLSEFNRTRQLVNERAVTDSVLDEARSRLRSAEANREEVRAAVKSAEAALNQDRALLDKAHSDVAAAHSGIEVARADARRAEALLDYVKIEAPFDGVITRRHIDTGHLTVPGRQGEPLFVVARTDVVSIAVAVPEMYAAAVDRGDRATVRLQALGGRSVEAKVSRTSYVLDHSTRTLRVEIDLPNADGVLRPGLYAYVVIVAEEHADAMTVPATAVVQDGLKTFCVRVASAHAERRPIEVGLTDGSWTEVLSGLKSDEVVVKANASSIADGQLLDVVELQNQVSRTARP